METTTFDQEALGFALDGDTVNNLVALAQTKWNLKPEETIARIKELAKDELLQLYILTHATGVERNISANDLSTDLLKSEPYVFLTKTEKTLRNA